MIRGVSGYLPGIGTASQRLATVILVAITLGMAVFSPAHAHATLIRANPSPGSTVGPLLTALQLVFDEPLGEGSYIIIFNSDFQAVGDPRIDLSAEVMQVRLDQPLEPGVYTIQWKAVTSDGHNSQGSYRIGVRGQPFFWSHEAGLAAVLLATGLVTGGITWFWRRSRV